MRHDRSPVNTMWNIQISYRTTGSFIRYAAQEVVTRFLVKSLTCRLQTAVIRYNMFFEQHHLPISFPHFHYIAHNRTIMISPYTTHTLTRRTRPKQNGFTLKIIIFVLIETAVPTMQGWI